MNRVREQYENWVYPLPVDDLDADFRAGSFDRSDPSLFRRKLWPRPVEPANLKILIAGCGTVQAARYAYRNRSCSVLGIDISQASLDHQNRLKEKHGLENLRLQHLSILDVEKLGEQFDLIVSTGVLHHLPDPGAGLRKLKLAMLPHGVMSIMLYGWYRRFGVYMMQEAFRMLGVTQSPEGVGIVRETLAALPAWHHVNSYAKSSPDLNFDGGIVDTFLHPCDRSYTVPQVLEFASSNGLKFQDWMDRRDYSLSGLVPDNLQIRPLALRLEPEQQWHLVELLGQSLGMHGFLLCHPDRDPADYTIDFSSGHAGEAWLAYTPSLRPPIDVRSVSDQSRGTPATLRRGIVDFTLNAAEAAMFALVDGRTTIAEIVAARTSTPDLYSENRRTAHRLFSWMHDHDHLMYRI
jgi:SAM-dependent methyltransferase